MKELIDELFNSNIDIILKDFNEDEIDEVKNGYLIYLNNQYLEIDEDEVDLDELLKLFIEVEQKNWANKSKQEKQILLLKDSALDKLKYMSGNAQDYAIQRLNNDNLNITKEQADTLINQIKEQEKLVRDFNISSAKKLVSEGILDLLYAAKLTNNTSLRVGRRR